MIFRWIALLGLLPVFLLMGCTGEVDSAAKQRLNSGQVLLLGHGGNGTRSLHPLNGISGIFCTMANGADGTEVDVRQSFDDTLVLFHDAALAASSNCDGSVETSSWRDLQYCEHSALLANDTLLSLNQLIRYPAMLRKVISVDVKFPDGCTNTHRQRMARALAVAFINRKNEQNFVESQDRKFLKFCRQMGVNARLLYYTATATEDADHLRFDSLDGVSIDMKLVNRQNVAAWQAQGLFVLLWGAGTKSENVQAINLMPDAIESDRPAHLAKLRGN